MSRVGVHRKSARQKKNSTALSAPNSKLSNSINEYCCVFCVNICLFYSQVNGMNGAFCERSMK
jgi:hypothetical protein